MSSSLLSKLRFKVISFSSEDPDNPAEQLNAVNPSTKGWQSVRFCPFPQELVFELEPCPAKLNQIQILSHQSKISTKIEIFIGNGKSYSSATFKRLGYLSLDSNERSSHTARELKTVFVDFTGRYVKLLINENHINKLNIYNQVGIVAVSLLGVSEEALEMDVDKVSQIRNACKNPALLGPVVNAYNDLSIDMNLDPQTAAKLRQLADAKARAISREDYLTAKQIKNVEQELKTLGSKLAQLDMAKSEAVAVEDYDLAKEIKDESDELRGKIEEKIMAIKIPGMDVRSVPMLAPAKERGYQPDDDMRGGYRDGNLSARGIDKPNPAAAKSTFNVDDIVVGGGNRNAYKDYNAVEDDYNARVSPRTDGGSARGAAPGRSKSTAVPAVAVSMADESDLPIMERPINPKAVQYGAAGDEGDEGDDFGMHTGVAKEQFELGHHPLEGVTNFLDLPTPEPLAGKSKEVVEQQGIRALLGEYRSRCLFSKAWILREAVLTKAHMMLNSSQLPADVAQCLTPLSTMVKVAAEDKIQQVLLSGITLLGDVLKSTRRGGISKSVMVPLFDPIIAQFIEKLCDGNMRLRELSRKGLQLLAESSNIGPAAVGSHALKALPAKQKTAWRPIVARLQLLRDFVADFGLGSSTGLNADALLNFPKSVTAFSNSNAEVRDAAKDLVVAIQRIAGTPAVESIFPLLRPIQLNEYKAAFESVDDHEDKKHADHRVAKQLQHATHNPGGKVPTSAAKVADESKNSNFNGNNKSQDEINGDPPQDFTTCMFCAFSNKNWTENDLDVHYWKDCPLLISCPSCAQIVEIAGLPEHLLDECDAKDSYVPCNVTGLAIRSSEYESWQQSPQCVPAANACMYCPLCLSSVEDSDEAWIQHLTTACPKNTRTNGS